MDYGELTKSQLIEKLSKLESLIDSLQDIVFETDLRGQLRYANGRLYEFFKYPQNQPLIFADINVLDWVASGERSQAKERWAALQDGKEVGIFEYTLQRQDGSVFPAIVHSGQVIEDGQVKGIRGVIMDVSQRQNVDDQVKYISVHDTLTDLYNRAYFDLKMSYLDEEGENPHGLIICDLDGLKLINDTLGHEAGDILLKETAAVLKNCFRQTDVIARLGGDEFAIILPHCGEQVTANSFHRLQEAVHRHNQNQLSRLPLMISMGYAVSTEKSLGLKDLFRQADHNMYRDKIRRSPGIRNQFLEGMFQVLERRQIHTKEATLRLGSLLLELAKLEDIPPANFWHLQLLAQYHDIGKIGIPDHILDKPGPLTEEERTRMQRYCEIGQRIALAWPELNPVADWILKQHEWWNGQGYPRGLKEREIPLESRMMAVVTAYEAMRSERPYRGAMSEAEVVAQLEQGAGSQFDPDIVARLLALIKTRTTERRKVRKPVATAQLEQGQKQSRVN